MASYVRASNLYQALDAGEDGDSARQTAAAAAVAAATAAVAEKDPVMAVECATVPGRPTVPGLGVWCAAGAYTRPHFSST
jgi:hypothetical protein